MHRKYATDGLVAVSVSLDDLHDKQVKIDMKAKVLKFLQDRQATFPNFVLDEKEDVWQEKLKIDGPPCVYVFNRDGHWVKKFTEEKGKVDYAEVEKTVRELLKK